MLTELTFDQLSKLNTKRLLAYKKKINRRALGPYYEDWIHECTCDECMGIKRDRKRWETIYNNIKKVLATREHIEKR